MRMNAGNKRSEEPKGMILCPYCHKGKVVYYGDAKGHASIKCPNCENMAVFDFDQGSATPSAPIRGAVNRFKTA